MGYLHIENLYRPAAQEILKQSELYALEKVHGTSAHIAWDGKNVTFFSGGVKYPLFAALFNVETCASAFRMLFGAEPATVYGEAYGGKCQGMSDTYGKDLRFIVFDIGRDGDWLPVPDAAEITERILGLEFVPYRKIPATMEAIDAERDRPSEVAVRRGITEPKIREGIVLRPLVEGLNQYGDRLIAKHKRPEFAERKREPKVVDPAQLVIFEEANAVAEEWVTEMRLTHVLDKLGNPTELNRTGDVIRAMQEDVLREGRGGIAHPEEAMKAIGKKCASMYKARCTRVPVPA